MFYISSRGHSATGWLAKQISKHPRVVCWHGTRSIPPFDPGINDLKPVDFVKGLKACEKQRDNRIYGAVHGYHGSMIKDEILKNRGNFLCVFRDPISKIASFFFAYLWTRLSNGKLPEDHNGPNEKIIGNMEQMEKIDGYLQKKRSLINRNKRSLLFNVTNKIRNHITKRNYIKNKSSKNFNPKQIEKEILLRDNSKLIADLFDSICKTTFFYDNQLYENCEDFQIIQMEKMTTLKDYFSENVWNKIVPEFKNEAPLEDFNIKAKAHNPNFHDTAQQKYEYFPNPFQKHFKWYLSKQSKQLIIKYKKFDYFII